MENPNFRIGMTSAEVIVEIIRVNLKRWSPGFKNEFIWFHTYTPKENTQDEKTKSPSQLSFHDFSRHRMTGDKNEVLGIISELKISYSFTDIYPHHIPMMDFKCPKSPENLISVKELLKTTGQREGVILDSGRSYHYYGVNLLDERHWWKFLESCLLSELVDARYIEHRFKDRCSILRTSACPLRPKIPTVVAII